MSRISRALAPSLAFCLATLAFVGAATGADKPKNAASGNAAGNRFLTQAQLRDCLAQKDRLQAQTDAATKAKADIVADKAEIDRSGKALADETATLDRTSAEAVDAYNAKVDARDKLIDSYQAKVTAYNKEAEGVKATKDTYDSTCVDRRYDERDLKDVQKKK
jgi:hypothetical protein